MGNAPKRRQGIAVVGMSCWYPGAQSLRQFWENILAKRQQFRRMPDARLPLDQYGDADKRTADKTYGTEAAVIDGFEFDWKERRIPKAAFESTDIVHWLALEVALKALADSGLDIENLRTKQTGVILGNTLTGEWTRTNAMRTRWPFFERVLRETAANRGMDDAKMLDFIKNVEHSFKSVFPNVTEDTLAGALSNTIAGRICNVLDLHGGGYTVDGACSSSLLAVINAARSLEQGDLDVAFAGGIDISLDTFELIGFAKTGALTTDEMRVYDKRANGFIPGEGCGFVVLKRMEDAVKDGDKIYAALKGWAMSSDGKGGLTAPTVDGQAHAIGKAYDMAGYSLADVTFVEGHGTGTTLGDKVEISALAKVLGDKALAAPIGLTSLKSIVGHTKAAAGIGGFIKAAIAVNQRVAPPMAGVDDPNALFGTTATQFLPLIDGVKFPANSVIRAGVSAMGFGGINTHVTLESHGQVREGLVTDDQLLLASHDGTEVLPFSAHSQTALARKVRRVLDDVRFVSRAELGDLAIELGRGVSSDDTFRAVITVSHPARAHALLTTVAEWLSAPVATGEIKELQTAFGYAAVSRETTAPKIAFLFPGQGAQRAQMAKKLSDRHGWAKHRTQTAAAIAPAGDLSTTEGAQPAISLANALWFEAMQRYGIVPTAVAGHSLGELSALYAAGAFDFKTLITLAAARGKLMAAPNGKAGTMIYVACGAEQAKTLLGGVTGYATIANLNSPDQTVLSGDVAALEQVAEKATKLGIQNGRLQVTNAFHSDYMNDAAAAFGAVLAKSDVRAPERAFFRGTDGRAWQPTDDIRTYLCEQLIGQVDFVALSASIRATVDLAIEVGPGATLTGLLKRNAAKDQSVTAVPVESRARADGDVKTAVAMCFARGSLVSWTEVNKDRFSRPYVSPSEKVFVASPTEKPLHFASEAVAAPVAVAPVVTPAVVTTPAVAAPVVAVPDAAPAAAKPALSAAACVDAVVTVVAVMTEFDAKTLKPELRLMDDLNMDSIKVTELMFRVSKHFGLEATVAQVDNPNASLAEVAGLFFKHLTSGAGAIDVTATAAPVITAAPAAKPATSAPDAAAVAEVSRAKNRAPWVRNFTEVLTPRLAAVTANAGWDNVKVNVFGVTADESQLQTLAATLKARGAEIVNQSGSTPGVAIGGQVSIVLLPATTTATLPSGVELLTAISRAKTSADHMFVLLQIDDGKFGQSGKAGRILSGKAFAQSLGYERPAGRFLALSVDKVYRDEPEWLCNTIARERAQSDRVAVVGYTQGSIRCIPQLVLDDRSQYEERNLELASGDVIIVTGGGKGITAACALELSRTHQTKMALIGSSPLTAAEAQDPAHPVGQTLLAYKAAGLTALYYTCDITDAAQVAALTLRIRRELGAPAGIVHGAGTNQPRPAALVTTADALKELKPKVLGMANLLAATSDDKMKLVVGLTSVIGVVGMPGNSWYGLANEALDLILRDFGRANRDTSVVSLAYSVWSDVGMGARLGSDKHLEARGIGSISPEDGVARFMELVKMAGRDQQTIVTSRLGTLSGSKPAVQPEHEISFTDRVTHFQPGVEAIVKVKLTHASHAYLKDHNYKGSYLFPTVYGLEAMAQVASLLHDLHGRDSVSFEGIKLTRPIAVPSDDGLEIEIYAEVLEKTTSNEATRIRTGIRTPMTGYKVDHFAADVVLSTLSAPKAEGVPAGTADLGIKPMTQLYGPILFQGPKFQRLESFKHLESDNETAGNTVFVARSDKATRAAHLLGDPFFRDALLQSAQVIIPQNQCLPVEIERLDLYTDYRGDAVRTCFTDVYKADDKTYLATIQVFDAQGRILESMTNYRLQYLEKRPSLPKAMDLIPRRNPEVLDTIPLYKAGTVLKIEGQEAKDMDLLAPYKSIAERLKFDALPNGPQGQAVFVRRFMPDFRAFSQLSRSIYFSHFFNWMGESREMSLAPALAEARTLTETGKWGMITNWANIEVLGDCKNKDRLIEARTWMSGKLMGKANASGVLTFDWIAKDEQGNDERLAVGHMGFTWVEILDHGVVRPAEMPAKLKAFFVNMMAKTDAKDTYTPAHEPYRNLQRGAELFTAPKGPNPGIPLATKTFETGLFHANLVGNLYFSNYSGWMGQLRDRYFFDLAPELYRGVGEAGELTCVNTHIQHLREAMPFDEIQVTMAVTAVFEQGVHLSFEFFKLNKDGSKEKLAAGEHQAIWTKTGADGNKVSVPLPAAVQAGLMRKAAHGQLMSVA